jgi:hypothetical protein
MGSLKIEGFFSHENKTVHYIDADFSMISYYYLYRPFSCNYLKEIKVF